MLEKIDKIQKKKQCRCVAMTRMSRKPHFSVTDDSENNTALNLIQFAVVYFLAA